MSASPRSGPSVDSPRRATAQESVDSPRRATAQQPVDSPRRATAQEPANAIPADDSFDDRSAVRTRAALSPGEAGAKQLERAARIEQKIRVAKLILEDLPASDTRARLLRIAIVRRDEVVIDGVLSSLAARRSNLKPLTRSPSSHPPERTGVRRVTLLPPPRDQKMR